MDNINNEYNKLLIDIKNNKKIKLYQVNTNVEILLHKLEVLLKDIPKNIKYNKEYEEIITNNKCILCNRNGLYKNINNIYCWFHAQS